MKSTLIAAAALAALAPQFRLVAQAPATSSTPAAAPANNPASAQKAPPSLPPPGIAIPEADRAELSQGVEKLKQQIDALKVSLNGKPAAAFLPDVEIFHKAVDWPLRHNEFFNIKEVPAAKKYLAMGAERAALLAKGEHPWTTQTGLVVRGYRSKVDDSVQPYGLVVPANWQATDRAPRKSLIWLLGRGNNRTEMAFLNERLGKPPEITCAEGFVVVPYGRFCNATKFAGETDVFEVITAVAQQYPIDAYRITLAGFSMGGASAWHLGAHHAGKWCSISPGAGFAETREYAKVFAAGKTPPPSWEQTLWRWYDATEYAANLANTPTLAYSGEIDKQIQSAEIMKRFAVKEGVTIEHFIGPKTEHKYEPETRKKLQARIDEIAAQGRPQAPSKFRWVTNTLIYPGLPELSVLQMGQQWERAELSAEVQGDTTTITTSNVQSFRWNLRAVTKPIMIDGQPVQSSPQKGGARFTKSNGKWEQKSPELAGMKQPGMCGPIDHAFMSSFVFVEPTGTAWNPKVGTWAASEMTHAQKYWRQIFRGDVPLKKDTAITDADISERNLILWGDPSSNAVLKRIVEKLPVQWTKEKFVFDGKTHDASKTAPVLIFPNPLNPNKYVVLNSGVTFRESAMGTNSQQTPKLPDWAVVDLDTPAGADWPGKVVSAGFFDEAWKVTPKQPSQPK